MSAETQELPEDLIQAAKAGGFDVVAALEAETGKPEPATPDQPEAPPPANDDTQPDLLAQERQLREQAERQAQLLAAALAKHVQDNKPATTPQPSNSPPMLETLDAETMKALQEDFPEIARAIEAQQKALGQVVGKLSQYEAEQARRVEMEQQAVAVQVQKEIDSNPSLAYWQKHNPELWNAAIALDDTFKSLPHMQSLSLAERFGKVAAAMEALHGKPVATPTPTPTTAPTPKAKAGVFSLGDLPGGEAHKSADAGIEEASYAELSQKFMNMNAEQIDKYLAEMLG